MYVTIILEAPSCFHLRYDNVSQTILEVVGWEESTKLASNFVKNEWDTILERGDGVYQGICILGVKGDSSGAELHHRLISALKPFSISVKHFFVYRSLSAACVAFLVKGDRRNGSIWTIWGVTAEEIYSLAYARCHKKSLKHARYIVSSENPSIETILGSYRFEKGRSVERELEWREMRESEKADMGGKRGKERHPHIEKEKAISEADSG